MIDKKEKALFVGCGIMGAALLKGMHRVFHETNEISVVKPHRDEDLEKAVGDIPFYTSLEQRPVEQRVDILILCIKPQAFSLVLPSYAFLVARWQPLVVSIAAGQNIDHIQTLLEAPTAAIVRVMPNLPVLVGAGMSAGFASPQVTSLQRQTVQRIFESLGIFEWVTQESLLNAITALSGSGPGYFFYLIETFANAALDLGLAKDQAQRIILQTFLGSALYLNKTHTPPQMLCDQMTSIQGTTAAGLNVLQDAQGTLKELINKALKSAYGRARELES